MSDRDIIDDIDALVDEQMAGGEPRGGFDYGDPDYPRCPHCSEGWHGLKITRRMREMRWGGAFDEDYRYAADDSEVLCPGSDFIGPWANADQLARQRAWKRAGVERQYVAVGWGGEAFFEDTHRAYDRLRRDAGRRGVTLNEATSSLLQTIPPPTYEELNMVPLWQLPPNPFPGIDGRQPFRAEITPAGELERFTLDRPLQVGDRVRVDFGNGRHWTGRVAELRPDGLPRLAVDEPHVQETIQRFNDTVRRIAELVLPGVADSFRQITESLRPLMQDLPYDMPDARTPQERALPRPSHTPPMWAVQPNRRNRRRNR